MWYSFVTPLPVRLSQNVGPMWAQFGPRAKIEPSASLACVSFLNVPLRESSVKDNP